MKTSISQILFTTACLGLLFFANCKKEKPECGDTNTFDKRVPLSKSLRSLVPHTGRDTLIFFNQYGDTVFLKGIGTKNVTIHKSLRTIYPGTGSGGGKCQGYINFFIDLNEIQYIQDTFLSNSSRLFPFNSIIMNADSAREFDNITGLKVDVQIWAENAVFEAYYGQFVDQYYTHVITINNDIHKCMSFNVAKRKLEILRHAIYFNHREGIIQVIENDTIIWNRIFD